MSEHDWCQDVVPCWVDTLQPDPGSAVGFYAELFGWEVENRTASDSPQKYFVCMLRGRDVAGIGAQPSKGVPPDWNTYVRVDSVEEAAARAVEAGGSVILEPFDWLDGVEAAILEDHAGAALGVMERAPGRAGRQRAGGVGDVRAQHPRRGGLQALLRYGVRLGYADIRRRRTRADEVAPARVRRGGAGAAGTSRCGRRDGVHHRRGLPRRRPGRAATPPGAGRGGRGAALERQLLGPRRGRGCGQGRRARREGGGTPLRRAGLQGDRRGRPAGRGAHRGTADRGCVERVFALFTQVPRRGVL